MQRYLSYIGMFIGVVLLQIFLIDNISLGIYFHPLIYVAFIILLPLDMLPVWVVLLSATLGLTMDMMTGMCGLNVIAATATGFARMAIIGFTSGLNTGVDDTIPALYRLPQKNLLTYIILMVLMHSIIYFVMESLSMAHMFHTLLRIVVSDVVAVVIVWYIVKLFVEKILNK
ncbi:MAG: rod shape-determining protein MreD [Alistipes sp.]|nr:rod shape-determining protein MreD [Alistipes sp.]MBQ5875537.1 rod shape-determining protein MreD [Alistipes sp.]